MNIFDKEDESSKEIREKMANQKRMISKLDVKEVIGEAVSSAISAMVLTHDVYFANIMAAIDATRSLDKLFSEESRDDWEKNTEATDAEFEKKYDDLKRLLFTYAATWSSPSKVELTDHRTAEIERSAKQTTLLSLILEAGLRDEYQEWLDTVHVK